MSLFERIQKRILIEKKSDNDYFAKDIGTVYKTEKDYDNRPFTKYELDQAAKANTKAKTLRKKFKGAKYDGPPFARQTRKFDTQYTKSDGTKKVSPSFFDKRKDFNIGDDGKVDIKGVKDRMGSRFFSAREKQYKDTLKQIETDTKAGKDTTKLPYLDTNLFLFGSESGSSNASLYCFSLALKNLLPILFLTPAGSIDPSSFTLNSCLLSKKLGLIFSLPLFVVNGVSNFLVCLAKGGPS